MEKWQLETAERLASIERSIRYIETNIANLPPSPTCITNDAKLEASFRIANTVLEDRISRLEEFKKYVTIRIAWVSGAFAVIASGIFSAFDSIKMFFKTL
jgi:hypothetical protein